MRVLVTGGAGYIGGTVAEALLGAGHDVVILDNLSTGHREAVPSAAELVVGDVGDRDHLDLLLRGQRFDAVMHFAASIEAGESMKFPERFFRNNTATALTLLEAIHAAAVRNFVFSSTAALFGNPIEVPIVEDAPLQPTNVYGESKLMVERMLSWFHKIHGLNYASLRYFNAAGSVRPDKGEAHQPETHLIPRILQVALGQSKHIQVFGTDYPTPDGTCVRDYIHVADLASAHVLALEKLKTAGGELVYNLGNGHGFSVKQVIEVARKVTGHAIPVIESPRRAGDPAVLVASSAKIEKELAWQPKFPRLDSIMESAWAWHKGNPDGFSHEAEPSDKNDADRFEPLTR